MALFKELSELQSQLKYYEEMIPVNNMGKWSRSVAIASYKKKIVELQNKIAELKIKYKKSN